MLNWNRWTAALILLLLANSAYLASTASPTVFYMANVLAHIALGLAATAVLARYLWRHRGFARRLRLPAALLLVSALAGAFLTVFGAIRANHWVLLVHIACGVVGLLWLAGRAPFPHWLQMVTGLAVCIPCALLLMNSFDDEGIENAIRAPISMEEEGAGPGSPFWPSAALTNTGETVPGEYFLSSEKCGECHTEIFEQWNASAHHFASFNNQFYRASIEHMQEVSGSTESSRWCAGCHDHAVLFSGKWDIPIREQIDTPEAQAGLGCVSCHSITKVHGTTGNAGFTIEYPEIHDLAASDNPILAAVSDFLTYADPEPHRRTFLKPFMHTSEYCSACHKVHLDKPVNAYRWLRGFNSYDNWQASGVSGQGARSFYYPEQPMQCADCHMPLVPSSDPAAKNGMVRSHRFPGANTALPHVNADVKQMEVTKQFLQSGAVSVDIFAASPVVEGTGLPMARRAGEGQRLMSTFAVGEEAEQASQVIIREVGEVSAPLEKAGAVFQPGATIRVDVVVRTRTVGHFFPGGTVDAFDVWLELKATDADGRVVFLSGDVAGDGKGPVDPGAHFYRSFMLDGAGNPVNKRNAWQTRSLLYVRLIPPGAADVAHYRIRIPEDARGPITLSASLNHRKFSHYFTQWAFAGRPVSGEANIHHDSRQWSFDAAEVPTLPITTLAHDEIELAVGDTTTKWEPKVDKEDWERWNDWGIGLLLQGDLKGAQYAFERASEADPKHPDGWVNIARALIREGETDAARPHLGKALELEPGLPRALFFKALADKAGGEYEEAIAALRRVELSYPKDRVVLNQLGRLYFLMRNYEAAATALERVLAIDPEDVQAHYTLMLVYRGLGREDDSLREQKLFQRFKADESSQRLTARRRRLSPEDNNERQAIHDHVSSLTPSQ